MKKFLILIFLFISCNNIIDNDISKNILITKPIKGINYYQIHQYDYDGKNEKHPIFLVDASTNSRNTNGRILGNQFISKNSGYYLNNDIWDLNTPGSPVNDETDIYIEDSVYFEDFIAGSEGNLIIEENGFFYLESLTVLDEYKIKVLEGGTLFIKNNLQMGNESQFEVLGLVIIGGNTNFGNESQFKNSNNNLYICGINNLNPDSNNEKNCNDLEIENNILFNELNNITLPINLLYQKGSYFNNKILLEWETVTEYNSDFILLNWSKDLNNWYQLDTIYTNNIPKKYFYEHKF